MALDPSTPVQLESERFVVTFLPAAAALEQIALKTAGGPQPLLAVRERPEPLFRLNWGPVTQQPTRSHPLPPRIGAEARLHLVAWQVNEQEGLPCGIRAEYEVTEDDRKARVALRIEVGAEIVLQGRVENESDATISEVLFPIVAGVRLEEDVQAETLFYPFYSGVRLPAPRRSIPQGRTDAQAAAPLDPVYDEAGGMIRHLYCGQLSMAWMAVEGEGRGLGVVHCDPAYEVTGLVVYAPGKDPRAPADGLDLAVTKLRPVAPEETHRLPVTRLVPYAGSWHQVADAYRSWAESQRFLPPRVPKWVRESHALTAHYDFKWADGTFHHTFSDIPQLYRRSAREGIGHLFLAGWFTGGFDHMYPEFFPDMELGTVMDFIDAVRTVCSEGGRVTFYINGSLFGRSSRYFDTLGRAWAAKDPEGKPVDRHFFGNDFVLSCRGVPQYQRLMRDTVRWLVGEVGASGVYIDTFAAMGPHLCCDPTHGHPHAAHWNRDSVATLRMVEDAVRRHNPEAFTMIEGCGDLYGQWVVAHLIQGWYYERTFPALFRYTFPEYVLVDMVYPSRGQSFRPARVSREAYDQLHRTFIHGCILWIYDQEDERFCNFRTDPEMWEYVKKLIALRDIGKRYFGWGRFRDTVGLQVATGGADVKRYQAVPRQAAFASGDLEMLAVWNRSGKDLKLRLAPDLVRSWAVSPDSLHMDAVGVDGLARVRWRAGRDGVDVEAGSEPILLIFISSKEPADETK